MLILKPDCVFCLNKSCNFLYLRNLNFSSQHYVLIGIFKIKSSLKLEDNWFRSDTFSITIQLLIASATNKSLALTTANSYTIVWPRLTPILILLLAKR